MVNAGPAPGAVATLTRVTHNITLVITCHHSCHYMSLHVIPFFSFLHSVDSEAKVFSFDIGQFPYTRGNAKLMKARHSGNSWLLTLFEAKHSVADPLTCYLIVDVDCKNACKNVRTAFFPFNASHSSRIALSTSLGHPQRLWRHSAKKGRAKVSLTSNSITLMSPLALCSLCPCSSGPMSNATWLASHNSDQTLWLFCGDCRTVFRRCIKVPYHIGGRCLKHFWSNLELSLPYLDSWPRLMVITALKEPWQIWRTSASWPHAGAESRVSTQSDYGENT